jgi:protein tyrosine/serine phosphatase
VSERVGDAHWIELEGAVNVRDLAELPTVDGRATRPDRLIRADNLQQLSPADVRRLVDEHHVRAVADLRSKVEVDLEGPAPLSREAAVEVHNFSLFPEAGEHTDVAADDEDAPVVLPWQTRGNVPEDGDRRGTAAIYLRYLDDRADSVIAALRLIAHTDGAAVVHCAAGKDRTGVVVAFALAEVGVTREAIVADYERSAERIEAIFARLAGTRTYREDVAQAPVDKHRPRAVTMQRLLDAMDAIHGGIPAWLRAHGWTEQDAAALRSHLLD